jgi:hypothetical protein
VKDLELALCELGRDAAPGGALCETSHTGEKLIPRERLYQVVVGAEEKTTDAIERLGALAGHEKDRETFAELLTQFSTHLVSAHSGETNVEDHEQRLVDAREINGLLAARGLPYVVSGALEGRRQERTQIGIVLDD